MIKSFEDFVSESKRTANVIGEDGGAVLVEWGFMPIMMFKKDFARHQAEEFKDVNLSKGYFTGTAIVGPDSGKKPKLVDYSSPFHKGQVIEPKEDEEEEDEEFDFRYDRHISESLVKKLAELYCKKTYVKGTVVKKIVLQ